MAPLLRSGAVDIPPQVTEEVILIEEVALGTDEGVLNLHDSAAWHSTFVEGHAASLHISVHPYYGKKPQK